jgi:hypothetical protein
VKLAWYIDRPRLTCYGSSSWWEISVGATFKFDDGYVSEDVPGAGQMWHPAALLILGLMRWTVILRITSPIGRFVPYGPADERLNTFLPADYTDSLGEAWRESMDGGQAVLQLAAKMCFEDKFPARKMIMPDIHDDEQIKTV